MSDLEALESGSKSGLCQIGIQSSQHIEVSCKSATGLSAKERADQQFAFFMELWKKASLHVVALLYIWNAQVLLSPLFPASLHRSI